MKKVILITFLFSVSKFVAHSQEYTPIKLLGFNHDVIAEGNPRITTTKEMDAINPSNFVLFSKKFAQSAGMPAGYGLPDNGMITSSKKQFQLEPFASSNALYLMKGTQGELRLQLPQGFDGITILGLATEGMATLNITINFSNGTSLRVPKESFNDWFDGTGPVRQGFGRVKRESGSSPYYEGAPTNPRMYTIDIATPNDREIRTIVFNNTSTGQNPASNRAFIFAISGFRKPAPVVPVVKTPEKKEVIVTPVPKEEVIKEVPKEVVKEAPKEAPVLRGNITDAKTNAKLLATVRFTSGGTSCELKTDNGSYQFPLADKKEYVIKITASGYLDRAEKVNLQSAWPPNNELSFTLQAIEVGVSVKLPSVLFKQSTATLLEQSYPELDAVVEFMVANPAIHIEVAGHTDNRGSNKANLKLSNDRASEIKQYLVTKGIGTDRITAKGYGGTKPIAPNDTEESRRLNRRVEFVITGK